MILRFLGRCRNAAASPKSRARLRRYRVNGEWERAAEAARLAAVRRYEILDAPPDGVFDDIAALAAAACGTPIATVSIVDAGRIWFAATYGLEGVTQIGDEPGLCASAILGDEVYVVPDAAIDPRTLSHPAVRGELGLRFYAAASIITAEGHHLGTVNVIDTEPRELTETQASQLTHLARVVARNLDLRLAAIHAVRAERELHEDSVRRAALVSAGRERAVAEGFVSIANVLVDGYDIVDMLNEWAANCARMLDISSVGLLLYDARDVLQVAAASSERTRDLERFQLQCDEGPCLDCCRAGAPVLVPELAAAQARWPLFASVAVEAGFASVHTLPVRLGDTVLGALGLFGTSPGTLNAEDLALGQAFAHAAAVALATGKEVAGKTTLAEQLQNALTSRVVLEQAKGILSEQGGVDMDTAFTFLRRYARDRNRKLTDLAAALVARELPARKVLDHDRDKSSSELTAARRDLR